VIYPQLLRADFDRLPRPLRDFHSGTGHRMASGTVCIRHASFLARLLGFPPAGDNIPVKLEVFATEDREVWTRQFGNVSRRSVQWVRGGCLIESAGPVRVHFRVFLSDAGMKFESVRTGVWGIPLPLRISATVRGLESAWEIDVRITAIGSYRGVMEPVA